MLTTLPLLTQTSLSAVAGYIFFPLWVVAGYIFWSGPCKNSYFSLHKQPKYHIPNSSWPHRKNLMRHQLFASSEKWRGFLGIRHYVCMYMYIMQRINSYRVVLLSQFISYIISIFFIQSVADITWLNTISIFFRPLNVFFFFWDYYLIIPTKMLNDHPHR